MKKTTHQLDLGLRSSLRWGGRREGAGRKPGPCPCDAHRRRPALAARFPCHVTLRVRRGLPSLRTRRLVAEVRRRFAPACDRGRFRVVHYSVQADHVHLIVEAASALDLANGMKAIAARFARGVNRVLGRSGAVLADRYHLRILRTPREVRRALAYVLLNARKHWRQRFGVAPPVRLDEASSGRWFDGWRSTPPETPYARTGPRDVAAPRTWILAAGWRRHGLIDPAEVPGS